MKSIVLQSNTKTKVVAIVSAVSLLMWALGLPAWINNTRAAGVTSFSDTLSDSAPSGVSDHTIDFATATGVDASTDTITITFPAGFNLATNSVAFGDMDLEVDAACDGTYETSKTLAATPAASPTWGAAVSGQVLTLTAPTDAASGEIGAGECVRVEIGSNATGGSNQIVNPGTGSYEIDIAGTFGDSGSTRVYIIDNISMTATVDTIFNFYINGRTTGDATANGESADFDANSQNDVATTATTIPWGEITTTSGTTGYVASHTLSVATNATNGFVVTLEQDQNMTSSANDDIDLFADAAETATPAAWAAPSGTLGSENTFGHYGITSEDADLNSDEFGAALYAGNINSPRQVFSHDAPVNGQSNGTGTANSEATVVGYKIQLSALQEAGDYSNTLTYIATPTF